MLFCRQDLPPSQAGWPSQLFAVTIAIFGLASFALVLALIEQVAALADDCTARAPLSILAAHG